MIGSPLADALGIALALLTIALALAAWRLLQGPSLADRILALDTLYVNALAVLILLGLRFETNVYFEAALVIGMLGFVGTVALAKFVLHRDIVQ